jgi:hypothetical protein
VPVVTDDDPQEIVHCGSSAFLVVVRDFVREGLGEAAAERLVRFPAWRRAVDQAERDELIWRLASEFYAVTHSTSARAEGIASDLRRVSSLRGQLNARYELARRIVELGGVIEAKQITRILADARPLSR